MNYLGHPRRSSLGQKSIHFGRCVKHQFNRRFNSFTSHAASQKRFPLLQRRASVQHHVLDFNGSALSESPRTLLRSGNMLTTFNRPVDLSTSKNVPPAPPIPCSFTENLSAETLDSTEFSHGIKKSTSSIAPSGIGLVSSTGVRPGLVLADSKMASVPRNRRRTPLTPDVLALTKLRRPEHIKSSIAQRIEELRQASLINTQHSDEKPPTARKTISKEQTAELTITCDYQNNAVERQWLKEQAQCKAPLKVLDAPQYVQLNHRLFTIRSIDFIDSSKVRFHVDERPAQNCFLTKCVKQVNILTILIISILRLIENTLSNLSIPGIQLLVNLIYVLILITIAIILLTNHQQT